MWRVQVPFSREESWQLVLPGQIFCPQLGSWQVATCCPAAVSICC